MRKNNNKLSDVCDELFYNENTSLKGSVGIKNLADALSMTDKEFEKYIKEL